MKTLTKVSIKLPSEKSFGKYSVGLLIEAKWYNNFVNERQIEDIKSWQPGQEIPVKIFVNDKGYPTWRMLSLQDRELMEVENRVSVLEKFIKKLVNLNGLRYDK